METLLIEANFRKKLFTTQGEMILDVQFSIKKGELVSIYGPSGVGKTTILRILAGLTDADEGEVIVDGETWFNSLKKINLQARKRPVGYMFQDYALFPNMSIKENLKFAQTEQDPKHIDELLTLFDLKELQNRKPTMLSGGQQQRVALARALAQYGITSLLVSHDLPEVFKLSKRVIMLEAGKIVKQGDPFEVLGSKRTSGKVQFMAEVLKVESEDILKVLTLLSGNSLVKVAVRDDDEQQYQPGDKVVIITKAFNPVIQKI
jgi:molybdate transport system ATP-binding protein